MSIVTGVVNAKSNKFDKFSICVDSGGGSEVWYSSKFEINANVGDRVSFESGPEGKKYCSKLSVTGNGAPTQVKGGGTVSDGSAPAQGGGGMSGGGKAFPVGKRDHARSIIRQNAMTQANALLTAGGKPYSTELLISTARELEAYAAGDIEMARVKARQEAVDAEKAAAAAEAARLAEEVTPEAAPVDDDPFDDLMD
jgi:hypothetical protein